MKATNKSVGGQLQVNHGTKSLPLEICSLTWPQDKVKLFLVASYLLVPVIQEASGMLGQQMLRHLGLFQLSFMLYDSS